MATGENAICSTTRTNSSATSDNDMPPAERRVSMINCSVWLLISIDSMAAIITLGMTAALYFVWYLIKIYYVVIAISFYGDIWPVACVEQPFKQHFRLVLECLEQCTTITHIARTTPPVVITERCHSKRHAPNWEQQGRAELEDDFPDESHPLCSSGFRISDHLT